MDHLNNDPEDVIIKATDPFYPILESCYSLVILGEYSEPSAAKLSISPAIDMVGNFFNKKVADPSKMQKKYVQFSGHDSTLAPYMTLTGVAKVDCVKKDVSEATSTKGCTGYPPVASNFIWELIKNVNGTTDYGVKFSYNAEYLDFCKNNKKDKQGQFYCTLDEFNAALKKHYVYSDYSKTCDWEKSNGEEANKPLIISLIIVSVILLILVFLLIGEVKKRQNNDMGEINKYVVTAE